VVACCPFPEQLALVRRNFELRGLSGQFLHANPASLPLESATIDVVCVSSLLLDETEFRAVIEEVYRVLKPGGKVLTLARAWWDVDFWKRCFPWPRWWKNRQTGGPAPSTCYSANTLRGMFARFVEHRVYKRQLRRSDLPHLWRWLPLPLLERLMGRVLVLKAFKPLSAALGMPVAA
jgi:SAM-dependent methyltransferase